MGYFDSQIVMSNQYKTDTLDHNSSIEMSKWNVKTVINL